jgi:hypothetical protein
MDFTAGFIGGALWTSLGVMFFMFWLFYRWGELLATKNRDIENLKNKYRGAIGVLRDRDGRTAQ